MQKLLLRKPSKTLTRAQAIAIGVEVQTAISYPDPQRAPDAFAELAGRSYDRGFNPLGTWRPWPRSERR